MKDAPRQPLSDRGYRVGVALVAVVALVVRFLYAQTKRGERLWGDALDYFNQGNLLLEGHEYVAGLPTIRYGVDVPTAAHPPGFVTVLAFLRKIGIDTPMGQRYAMGVLGTASVLVILACVTRLLGRRAGLTAGVVAALYPQLWINDGMLMSESLFIFGFAVGLLGIYAYFVERRWAWLAFGSLGLTVAASARAETIMLFPLVVVPLVLGYRDTTWLRRLGHLTLAAVFPLAMVVPWYVFNSSRFADPVPFTTGLGRAMRQGSCPVSFSGVYIGSYAIRCLVNDPAPEPPPGQVPDESVEDAYYRTRALAFMSAHMGQVPDVVLAREGRVWGLWRPHEQNVFDSFGEGRGSLNVVTWAQRAYWILGLLALAGLWQFRRLRIPTYPLVVEVVLTAFVAAVTFGNTRYRAGVEVVVVILAAAALDATWTWIASRRRIMS